MLLLLRSMLLLLLLLLLFWCLLLVGAGLKTGDLLGVSNLVAFLAAPVLLAFLALAVLAEVPAIWLVVTPGDGPSNTQDRGGLEQLPWW